MPKQKTGGAKPPPKDDAEQSRRFEETAREVGFDNQAESFEKALDDLLSDTLLTPKSVPAIEHGKK